MASTSTEIVSKPMFAGPVTGSTILLPDLTYVGTVVIMAAELDVLNLDFIYAYYWRFMEIRMP